MSEQALAKIEPSPTAVQAAVQTGMALSFEDMRARVVALNEFYEGVMQAGTDYDTLPGTPKPTLLQPGAQLLDGIFGLAPTFEELPSSVRDFERGFFFIEMRCRLISKQGSTIAAEGIGSCNSKEDKYRWRTAKRVCPACNTEAIIKGKAEYGGGWVCFKKQGGCGATYKDKDPKIEAQAAGRIENDDTFTLLNTISKMAQKRAHVAATLNATGASRIFTQDVEDLPPVQNVTVIDHQPVTTTPPTSTSTRRAAGGPATSPPEDDEAPPSGVQATHDLVEASTPVLAEASRAPESAPAGGALPFPEHAPPGEPAPITAFFERARGEWQATRAQTRLLLDPNGLDDDLNDEAAVRAALARFGQTANAKGLDRLFTLCSPAREAVTA